MIVIASVDMGNGDGRGEGYIEFLLGRFVFFKEVGEDVIQFDLVLVGLEETVFCSEHVQPKVFVFSFPFVDTLERSTNSRRCRFLYTQRGIHLDALELLLSDFFLLSFIRIVFGFAWHIYIIAKIRISQESFFSRL